MIDLKGVVIDLNYVVMDLNIVVTVIGSGTGLVSVVVTSVVMVVLVGIVLR